MSHRIDLVDLTTEVLFDSKTLFTEMAILRPNALAKTTTAFQWLHDHGINGVLIGGMATAHWSKDRELTPDVDVLIDDIEGVKQILDRDGVRYEALAGEEGRYSGITVPSLDLDFLDANSGNARMNKYVIQTATPQRIGGLVFKVADPHVLAVAKMWAGRNKDFDDSLNLFRGGYVHLGNLHNHLKTMKPYLKGSDLDPQDIMRYAMHMTSTLESPPSLDKKRKTA